MRLGKGEKMMPPEDPRMQPSPKGFVGAFAPFPRSTWIHPRVPNDDFDRVCKNIWSRAKEAEEKEFARGQGPPEATQSKDGTSPESKPGHRAEEQQKEAEDLGLSTKYEEDKQQHHNKFTLPFSYLSGRRHFRAANPAWVLSPLMEVEMKLNEEEAERKRNSASRMTLEAGGRDVEDKQRIVENSLKRMWVPQSTRRTDKQSSASEPGPLATNPICSATGDPALHLQHEEDPPLPYKLPRDTCESEDEQDTSSSSDSDSSDDDEDDDVVSLPGVRSRATNSSDDDSESDSSDSSDSEVEENEMKSVNGKPDSPSPSTEKDFPPLSTIRAGILPCPTEAPSSWKMHGRWEIPLSFHPHDIPADALARVTTAPARAPVQGRAEAPQANSKTDAPPVAPTRQEAYDLLADFPALQPPKMPSALGVLHDGNPKKEDARGRRGLTRPPNQRQENGASRQRRMENVPREVSSICAGDQKSVLNLQTLGSANQRNSPTVSCGEVKANNQPPPRGTDGAGVNARSWASAAKAGMKQAAAPQEKARPCTFQQIVTINRAKANYSVAQNFANKVPPSHQVPNPLKTNLCRGPQNRNPNRFVRPGYPRPHQHFGAQSLRTTCPPGFRCPRFPFQQRAGGIEADGSGH
ncbi:uncharacterized protein LOC108900433 isoform X1 [Lates japonicus]